MCCSPWGCKELDTTEQLNWTELNGNWDSPTKSCWGLLWWFYFYPKFQIPFIWLKYQDSWHFPRQIFKNFVAVVQSPSHVWFFNIPWHHARPPCPPLSPRVCSHSCPLSNWCYLTISSSVAPFSFCLQSSPASGSFPVSWLSASDGQSIGASGLASVLPMNIQGWFPLGLTGLISLLSKGLKSLLQHHFKRISSLVFSLLYGPTLTSIHDYWKNHSFDYTDLCQQSDVSAF